MAEKKNCQTEKKVNLAVEVFYFLIRLLRYIKIRICKLPLFIITCYSVIIYN